MDIREKIKTIPEKSGCYLYFNKEKKIIYVGKAKNLKKRVSSYFNKVSNFKTTKLVSEIIDMDFIITKNEKEALLLEENLIKKYKPRYNILLNDDKHYPYIAITNEKDPKYVYVRKYDKKYLKAYGPLPDGASALKILKVLQLLYPLKRCQQNSNNKPCIYYHIDQCSGACFKDVPKSYYDAMIKKIDLFFKGKSEEVREQLKVKMIKASNNLQFEEAGRIKNILGHLNFALFSQNVELNINEDIDVFNYFVTNEKICFVVLFYLNGKLSFKDYVIKDYDEENYQDELKSFLVQIYSKNVLPKKILLPKEIEIDDLVEIYENKIKKVTNKYLPLLNLAKKNAEETLKSTLLRSTTFRNKNQMLLEKLQKILNMDTYPYHIEVFDVANIYSEYVTGAMVVFKNGNASRNDFRKYNIQIEEQDDYHRMQYMIYKRYQKDFMQKDKLPDLIIMDGGIIQVHAAKSQLELLNISIPVIGLVKDERHKTSKLLDLNEKEILIKNDLELFNFLSMMQERIHNFAISSFRKRKNKGVFTNEFEKIPGVGQITIKKLVNYFSSISNLKEADIETINKTINNKKVAKNIFDYLHSSDN